MKKDLKKIKGIAEQFLHKPVVNENQALMLGKILSESVKAKSGIKSLNDVEFKVFSQFGDDGIIQWLINKLSIKNKTFIEFGVENYRESNTRFLMMNDNWSGFVMDGSEDNISQIINSEYFWRYDLSAKAVFIDRENINDLLQESNLGRDLGLLQIDIDGNDYWIWQAIKSVSAAILIVEYNCVFGIERSITVPYEKSFFRTKAHYSNLYWGASLPAFNHLAKEKGYAFVGCNNAGNNAYFVRVDMLNDVVKEVSLKDGFVVSKLRESLDPEGKLNYLTGQQRADAIKGLPVYNVITNEIEKF